MKLSIIAPPKLSYYEAITDFHLLPVHHLFDKDVRESYRQMRARGDYVILDNGVTETGTPCDVRVLAEYALAIDAQEIVLPDVFDDGPGTLESTYKALEEFKKLPTRPIDVKLMAVVHGKNLLEWTQVYETFLSCPDIDVIGFPKVMTKNFGSRFMALVQLFNKGLVRRSSYKEYHLLGVWDSPYEVPAYKQTFPWIRSIDTSVPVMCGIHNVQVSNPKRFRKFSLDESIAVDSYPRCTLQNIEWFIEKTGHAQGELG